MPRWQNFLKTDFRFHKKSKVTKTDSSQITSKDFDFHKLNFEIKLLISKKKKKKKKKEKKTCVFVQSAICKLVATLTRASLGGPLSASCIYVRR